MDELFQIKAEINIHKGLHPTWPIKSGYSPGFELISNRQTSESIRLDGEKEVVPGARVLVEIVFAFDELLGNIGKGTKFKFYEGPNEIGTGKVIEVIGWTNS